MTHFGDTVRTDCTQSTAELATRIVDVLNGTHHPEPLTAFVDTADDPKSALAAVRALGADVLMPYLSGKVPLTRSETDTLLEARRLFPLSVTSGGDTDGGRNRAWREWATSRAAARCGRPGMDAPAPDGTGLPDAEADAFAWRPWCLAMSRLSTLALPGLDGPVQEAARQHVLALARGATWAMLRRDHVLAASVARWLAHAHSTGAELPLEIAPLLDHIMSAGAAGPRTVLEIRIARRLLKETDV